MSRLGVPGNANAGTDPAGQYSTIVFSQEAVRRVEAHPLPQPFMFYLAYQAVHAPGEAPQFYVDMYKSTIADGHRRMFAGMLTCADEGIGNGERERARERGAEGESERARARERARERERKRERESEREREQQTGHPSAMIPLVRTCGTDAEIECGGP